MNRFQPDFERYLYEEEDDHFGLFASQSDTNYELRARRSNRNMSDINNQATPNMASTIRRERFGSIPFSMPLRQRERMSNRNAFEMQNDMEENTYEYPDRREQFLQNRPRFAERLDERKNHKHIQIKPEHFDGTEDFETYLNHFECCAKLGAWNENEKVWTLAACLKGQARRFFVGLRGEAKDDYQHLVFQLQQRFGSASRHGIYWRTQFENKYRVSGESIAAFTDELLLLTSKAYPALDTYTQQHLALQQFMKSLEPELKLKVIEHNCQTLRDAEEIVDVYETVMQTKSVRKSGIRFVKQENKAEKQEEKTTMPVARSQENRNRTRGPCFCCQSNTHFLKFCPIYKKCKEMENGWKNNRVNFQTQSTDQNQGNGTPLVNRV